MTKAIPAPSKDPPNTQDISNYDGSVGRSEQLSGPAFEFQSNNQVKDNKIYLLVQQYEQFTILEEESINSGFARFNTIITSLKALDEGFSSKNYVRKFLRALCPKWRAKVMAIEESKYLSSLALEEFIDNLKVHEFVMEKDSEIYKGQKKRVKSIALKAKKEFCDVETSDIRKQPREEKKSFRQRDENKGKNDRKCFRCGDPNHLIGDCPKPSCNKDQKAFIGFAWIALIAKTTPKDKTNDETVPSSVISSNVVIFNYSYYSVNSSSLDKLYYALEYENLCLCLEHAWNWMNRSKILVASISYNDGKQEFISYLQNMHRGNVVFGSNFKERS
ncbi:zf-CCHC domain-containing protein [Tanacetum coccineum]